MNLTISLDQCWILLWYFLYPGLMQPLEPLRSVTGQSGFSPLGQLAEGGSVMGFQVEQTNAPELLAFLSSDSFSRFC